MLIDYLGFTKKTQKIYIFVKCFIYLTPWGSWGRILEHSENLTFMFDQVFLESTRPCGNWKNDFVTLILSTFYIHIRRAILGVILKKIQEIFRHSLSGNKSQYKLNRLNKPESEAAPGATHATQLAHLFFIISFKCTSALKPYYAGFQGIFNGYPYN